MIKYLFVLFIQLFFYYSLGSLFSKASKNQMSEGMKVLAGISLSYLILIPIMLLPQTISSHVAAFTAISLTAVLAIVKLRKHAFSRSASFLRMVNHSKTYSAAFYSLCALMLIIFIILYITPLFGHDGKVIYFMKAKLLFEEGSRSIFEKYRLIPHNKYPLLLSLQEFLSLSLSFSSNPDYSSVIMFIIVIAVAWSTVATFASRGKVMRGFLLAIVYFSIPIHFMADGGFISRYADFPVSAFLLGLCISFYAKRQVESSLLFLFSLPLIKNEGYMIFLSFIIAVLFFSRESIREMAGKRIDKAIMTVGAFVLFFSVILKYLRYSPLEETSFRFLFSNLSFAAHLPKVLFDSFLQFINPASFGAVGIVVLIYSLLRFRRRPLFDIIFIACLSAVGYGIIICLIGGDFYKSASEILGRLNYQFMLPLLFFVFHDSLEVSSDEQKSEEINISKKSAKERGGMVLKWGLTVLSLIITIEIVSRLYWALFFKVNFFDRDGLKHLFYPQTALIEKETGKDDGKVRILLLGGSVLHSEYGNFSDKLECEMKRKSGQEYMVYNASYPAHTSLDSYYKYMTLSNVRFDYVFFYHTINELRANNVPTADYRRNYSHYSYYYLINSLMNDPLAGFTVIPFTARYLISRLGERSGLFVYVPIHYPKEDWLSYGRYVKSAESFTKNIERIRKIAVSKGEKLVIGTFAHYIPENYSKDLFDKKMLDYNEHYFPVELWGSAENVKRGLLVHNHILRETFSEKQGVIIVNFESLIPEGKTYFNDACHLTEAGCSLLAENLASAIINDIENVHEDKED